MSAFIESHKLQHEKKFSALHAALAWMTMKSRGIEMLRMEFKLFAEMNAADTFAKIPQPIIIKLFTLCSCTK